jgi:hypothetical protein
MIVVVVVMVRMMVMVMTNFRGCLNQNFTLQMGSAVA